MALGGGQYNASHFPGGGRKVPEEEMSPSSLYLVAELPGESSPLPTWSSSHWKRLPKGIHSSLIQPWSLVAASLSRFFIPLAEILTGGSQQEMIWLEIALLLVTASANVMAALISWAWSRSITPTFKTVFENRSSFFILPDDGERTLFLKGYVFYGVYFAI